MTAPYAGAPVSQTFRERWLTSNQVGSIRPTGLVEVRRGRLNRTYHHYPGLGYPPFGEYPGSLGRGFWYPDWIPETAWEPLDGIQDIKLDQSLDNNGITTLTIAMDNIVLVPFTGTSGIQTHIVEKGWYSPLRGFVGKHRPQPGVTKSPWFQVLPNAQIRVRQGYGADQLVTTFLGLVDDVDTDSVPNQLTITARDMGGVLVDQHFFGWAKEKDVPSPITFAPRSITEDHSLVGGGALASTTEHGNEADKVLGKGGKGWRSDIYPTPADTQWIEIKVPAGDYSQLLIKYAFANMEVFIGVKPTRPTSKGKLVAPSVDAYNLQHGVWWDPNGQSVPGHYGGWPYFAHIQATKGGPAEYIGMGGMFSVGHNTIFRLGFRNLGKVKGGYQAGVERFVANQRRPSPASKAGLYVTVQDVSDIVRCCLRWAGFKSWEVESTGTSLKEPYVAHPAQTFMDVINVVKDMVGYTFFIAEPRDNNNDQDLGYPIFRNSRVLENITLPTEYIDDKLLLTDARVKQSNQDDRSIIRARGVARRDGTTINGDTVKRLMYVYTPPWAGGQGSLQAGVLKPLTHTDQLFTTLADCQVACYLIAIQIAMSKYTAIIDLPANPGIGLDTLQSVIDRTQGLNSRLYITNRTQEMSFGANGFWTMELGGALIDTPDVDQVITDFKKALKGIDRKGDNPAPRKRKKKPAAP